MYCSPKILWVWVPDEPPQEMTTCYEDQGQAQFLGGQMHLGLFPECPPRRKAEDPLSRIRNQLVVPALLKMLGKDTGHGSVLLDRLNQWIGQRDLSPQMEKDHQKSIRSRPCQGEYCNPSSTVPQHVRAGPGGTFPGSQMSDQEHGSAE